MSVVKLSIIRARSMWQIWTLLFLDVRRHSHWTSASNWESKAWKFSHTERKSYACALTYPAGFTTALISLRTRLHKSRMYKNGLAMAGQAGWFQHLRLELSLLYLPLITVFASFICWLWLHSSDLDSIHCMHVVLLCVLMHSVTSNQHVQN